MLNRTFEPTRLNEIVNHPSIYPHVCGAIDGPLDLTPLVKDVKNCVLIGEHGAFVYTPHQRGFLEVHSQVLPEGRGKWAMAAARESLRWMFTRTQALEVITRVAKGNYAALALAKACGLKPVMTVPKGWQTKAGPVDCTVLSIHINDWLAAPGDDMVQRGEDLRGRWISLPITDSGLMGAVHEMMLNGQCAKAAIFLRRWLALAGNDAVVEPLTDSPARIKIGDNIVVARDEKTIKVF